MLIASMCFWDISTNTFQLPCGMITPTFFDIAVMVGVRPIGLDFDPAKVTRTDLAFSFSWTTYCSFIEDHQEASKNIFVQEHIIFLTYWLLRYVFSTQSIQVAKTYMPITTQLHEGRKICMSRLILNGLYESLALEVADMVRPENPNSIQIGGHVWLLQLWLIATLESSPKTKIPPNPTTSIKGS